VPLAALFSVPLTDTFAEPFSPSAAAPARALTISVATCDPFVEG
jgi:hypothetical protein